MNPILSISEIDDTQRDTFDTLWPEYFLPLDKSNTESLRYIFPNDNRGVPGVETQRNWACW